LHTQDITVSAIFVTFSPVLFPSTLEQEILKKTGVETETE
jgi:hypothetical protein